MRSTKTSKSPLDQAKEQAGKEGDTRTAGNKTGSYSSPLPVLTPTSTTTPLAAGVPLGPQSGASKNPKSLTGSSGPEEAEDDGPSSLPPVANATGGQEGTPPQMGRKPGAAPTPLPTPPPPAATASKASRRGALGAASTPSSPSPAATASTASGATPEAASGPRSRAGADSAASPPLTQDASLRSAVGKASKARSLPSTVEVERSATTDLTRPARMRSTRELMDEILATGGIEQGGEPDPRDRSRSGRRTEPTGKMFLRPPTNLEAGAKKRGRTPGKQAPPKKVSQGRNRRGTARNLTPRGDDGRALADRQWAAASKECEYLREVNIRYLAEIGSGVVASVPEMTKALEYETSDELQELVDMVRASSLQLKRLLTVVTRNAGRKPKRDRSATSSSAVSSSGPPEAKQAALPTLSNKTDRKKERRRIRQEEADALRKTATETEPTEPPTEKSPSPEARRPSVSPSPARSSPTAPVPTPEVTRTPPAPIVCPAGSASTPSSNPRPQTIEEVLAQMSVQEPLRSMADRMDCSMDEQTEEEQAREQRLLTLLGEDSSMAASEEVEAMSAVEEEELLRSDEEEEAEQPPAQETELGPPPPPSPTGRSPQRTEVPVVELATSAETPAATRTPPTTPTTTPVEPTEKEADGSNKERDGGAPGSPKKRTPAPPGPGGRPSDSARERKRPGGQPGDATAPKKAAYQMITAFQIVVRRKQADATSSAAIVALEFSTAVAAIEKLAMPMVQAGKLSPEAIAYDRAVYDAGSKCGRIYCLSELSAKFWMVAVGSAMAGPTELVGRTEEMDNATKSRLVHISVPAESEGVFAHFTGKELVEGVVILNRGMFPGGAVYRFEVLKGPNRFVHFEINVDDYRNLKQRTDARILSHGGLVFLNLRPSNRPQFSRVVKSGATESGGTRSSQPPARRENYQQGYGSRRPPYKPAGGSSRSHWATRPDRSSGSATSSDAPRDRRALFVQPAPPEKHLFQRQTDARLAKERQNVDQRKREEEALRREEQVTESTVSTASAVSSATSLPVRQQAQKDASSGDGDDEGFSFQRRKQRRDRERVTPTRSARKSWQCTLCRRRDGNERFFGGGAAMLDHAKKWHVDPKKQASFECCYCTIRYRFLTWKQWVRHVSRCHYDESRDQDVPPADTVTPGEHKSREWELLVSEGRALEHEERDRDRQRAREDRERHRLGGSNDSPAQKPENMDFF